MLSGGTVGQFFEPDLRQSTKVETQLMAPKGAAPLFSDFPILGADGLTVFHFLTVRPSSV